MIYQHHHIYNSLSFSRDQHLHLVDRIVLSPFWDWNPLFIPFLRAFALGKVKWYMLRNFSIKAKKQANIQSCILKKLELCYSLWWYCSTIVKGNNIFLFIPLSSHSLSHVSISVSLSPCLISGFYLCFEIYYFIV